MLIFICIIIIILLYILFFYNSLIKLNNNVKEAFSTMDVYLKKRWDLIPNIVETIKGYTKYEAATLEKIVTLRNINYNLLSEEEKIKENTNLNNEINKFMVLAENYPNLKASENFKDLNNSLTKVEDEIANSRKYYNATVRIFNNKIEIFPNNILAKIFGYKRKNMFELDNKNETNKINVKL